MKDDISEIITDAECYTINNATSIYAYKNNTRETYTQIGGKWKKSGQSSYNYFPSGSYCVAYSEIEDLNSYAMYEPLYVFNSLILACFVIGFSIWLIFGRIFKHGI